MTESCLNIYFGLLKNVIANFWIIFNFFYFDTSSFFLKKLILVGNFFWLNFMLDLVNLVPYSSFPCWQALMQISHIYYENK